jgi:L-malate glycosyltransferase
MKNNSPRILILGDINSPHLQKWICGLAGDNFNVGVFSLNKCSSLSTIPASVNVLYEGNFFQREVFSKALYLFLWPRLLFTIFKFKPDIIHAHYASSYGLLGALTFFKPFFVSAWGSDVMDFPKKNRLNRFLLKFVFWRANKLFASSTVLQSEVSVYIRKSCAIIPFGVNLSQFYNSPIHNKAHFTFGCIKHLEKIYNIDKVIQAFSQLVKKYPDASLRLLVVGKGSEQHYLEELVSRLGIGAQVVMTGQIPHAAIPDYLNSCDVLVNVSENESFGVSIAEALACQIPVIVSNIAGFKDLVPDENFGLIARTNQTEDIARCMETYYLDSDLRKAHAAAGYKSVVQQFNWRENLLQMERFYYDLCHT